MDQIKAKELLIKQINKHNFDLLVSEFGDNLKGDFYITIKFKTFVIYIHDDSLQLVNNSDFLIRLEIQDFKSYDDMLNIYIQKLNSYIS